MLGEKDIVIPAVCGKKVYDLAPANKMLVSLPGLSHDELSQLDGIGSLHFGTFIDLCIDPIGSDDEKTTVITETIGVITETIIGPGSDQ
jgi:hypothetical protein